MGSSLSIKEAGRIIGNLGMFGVVLPLNATLDVFPFIRC
jgi:hypothetical protein